jgi:hypothetical protein
MSLCRWPLTVTNELMSDWIQKINKKVPINLTSKRIPKRDCMRRLGMMFCEFYFVTKISLIILFCHGPSLGWFIPGFQGRDE